MLHYRFLYLVLFAAIGKPAFSQPDSIWSLQPDKRVYTLSKWYFDDLAYKDSSRAMAELTNAEKRSIKKNNQLLRQQAWLLQQLYTADRKRNTELSAAIMVKAANEAAEKNWPVTQAECWHYAGLFHYKDSRFNLAFEFMLKAQTVFDEHTDDQQNIYLHRYENTLGNCYYHFGEYREAIKYLTKTIRLPAYWNSIISTPALYNNFALCYLQLKNYDSAATWFNRSYESAIAFKDPFYMVLAQGNLGNTYYLQQQYDKALPLLEIDYNGSLKAKQTGSAVNAAMTIADIHIKNKQPQLAEKYLHASREYVYNSHSPALLKTWYQNLYNLAKANADHKNISLFADSLLAYKDSVAAMLDKKAFNQAVLKFEPKNIRTKYTCWKKSVNNRSFCAIAYWPASY